MSELPKGWTSAILGEIADINPRVLRDEIADETLVTFLPMPAVEAQTGCLNRELFRTWSSVKKGFTSFRDGDVLFAKITPCMENGKVAVCSDLLNGVGAGSTEFHVIRPVSGSISSQYLLFYLLQRTFRSDARLAMKGAAGQLRVPTQFLAERAIPLAPFAEQRRIVAEIEKQFTRLEAAEAILHRAKRKTSVIRKEIVGPCKLNFDGSQTLPELPNGWSWRFAKDLCQFITKGTTPAKHDFRDKDGIPYIKVNNLGFNGELNFEEKPSFISPEVHETDLARSEVVPGDVLMNIVGPPLGKVSKVPPDYPRWNINQAVARFRPKAEVTSEFLAIVLQSTWTLRWLLGMTKATVGQVNLTLEICRNIPVPVPPIGEQKVIVDRVEALTSELDKNKEVLKLVQSHSARLRQAILARAFSGQLVPQDPNDEPASVLLERIRTERGRNGVVLSKSRRSRTPEAALQSR